MSENQSSYRQIIKATSIFGGVQVFNIIISIIKSKFVAVLLGPEGMGIMGLLTSTTNLVARATNFGIGTSAVKDVAASHGTGDENRVANTITVVRRLVWITGLLGFGLTFALSPWLSKLTFGNNDYTLAFVWISITLLFEQLSKGQLVVLQGLRKLNYLAKANLYGSFLGLLITVPLYYFFDIDGIVPAIIATGFISLSMSWVFSRKIKIKETVLTLNQIYKQGGDIVRLGFMISLSGFLSVGASYAVRIFISRTGGVDQVGLYNAGFAIINTYVGLIFNAMVTDYYPRLSAVADDKLLSKRTINQQAEIALLILAPILILFIVFIKWVIILLYSYKFIGVSGMMYWAALGIFFKSAGWCMSYYLLAKGMSKLFFWNEFSAHVYFLTLNILGYYFWGLTGLGISFAVSYLVYLIQLFIVSKKKFEFSFHSSFLKLFLVQFCLALTGFFAINFLSQNYAYIIGAALFILSGLYSFFELEKRIGIKKYLMSKSKSLLNKS